MPNVFDLLMIEQIENVYFRYKCFTISKGLIQREKKHCLPF